MYALKRMAAYAIDLILLYTPIAAALAYGEMRLLSFLPVSGPRPLGDRGLGNLDPTPRRRGRHDQRPDGPHARQVADVPEGPGPLWIAARHREGILREIVKLVALGFFLGIFWALQGMIARGQTFYDEWMDIEVEDLNPVGLTPTQKNFRKYMRQRARLKGR